MFQQPIKDFCLPVVSLKDWFPLKTIRNKRSEIAGIIRDLAKKSNPASEIAFPDIDLVPKIGYEDQEDEDYMGDHQRSVTGLQSLTLSTSTSMTSKLQSVSKGGGVLPSKIKVVKTFVPRLKKVIGHP